MSKIASADRVSFAELLEFIRPRHRATFVTVKKSGELQISPVTCGVDDEGRIVISTYRNGPRPRMSAAPPRRCLCVSTPTSGTARTSR